jgi:hypothetical protein
MTNDERLRDEELAAFTDALLEGKLEMETSSRPPLADTVEKLARALSPQALPTPLRHKVRRQIAAEWPQLSRPLGQPLRHWLGSFGRSPLRWACAVAGVLVVVVIAAVLCLPTDNLEITGTIGGQINKTTLIAVVGLVSVLGLGFVIAWLTSRRR